jgi:hypothetical protein
MMLMIISPHLWFAKDDAPGIAVSDEEGFTLVVCPEFASEPAYLCLLLPEAVTKMLERP